MITPGKFLSLPRGTRLRKVARLLRQWQTAPEDPEAMRGILSILAGDGLPPESEKLLAAVLAELASPEGESPRWNMNALMYALKRELGLETADWDFPQPAGPADSAPEAGSSRRETLPCRVYVDGIRSPFNLGAIFRSAECFGAREIFIEPGGASPLHPRAVRSAMGCMERVPWSFMEYGAAAGLPGLFALELGGTPLEDFRFPLDGICVVGSEELGVRPELREAAKKKRGHCFNSLAGRKGFAQCIGGFRDIAPRVDKGASKRKAVIPARGNHFLKMLGAFCRAERGKTGLSAPIPRAGRNALRFFSAHANAAGFLSAR